MSRLKFVTFVGDAIEDENQSLKDALNMAACLGDDDDEVSIYKLVKRGKIKVQDNYVEWNENV